MSKSVSLVGRLMLRRLSSLRPASKQQQAVLQEQRTGSKERGSQSQSHHQQQQQQQQLCYPISPAQLYAQQNHRSVRLRYPSATEYEVHQILMREYHQLQPDRLASLHQVTAEHNALHSGAIHSHSGQCRRDREEFELKMWQTLDDEKRSSLEEYCAREKQMHKMYYQREALKKLQERYAFPKKNIRGHRLYMLERMAAWDDQNAQHKQRTYQGRMQLLREACTEYHELAESVRGPYEQRAARINAAYGHARITWALHMVACGRPQVAYRLVPEAAGHGWTPAFAAFAHSHYSRTAERIEQAHCHNKHKHNATCHVSAILSALEADWAALSAADRADYDQIAGAWTSQRMIHDDHRTDEALLAKSEGIGYHHYDHEDWGTKDNWLKPVDRM